MTQNNGNSDIPSNTDARGAAPEISPPVIRNLSPDEFVKNRDAADQVAREGQIPTTEPVRPVVITQEPVAPMPVSPVVVTQAAPEPVAPVVLLQTDKNAGNIPSASGFEGSASDQIPASDASISKTADEKLNKAGMPKGKIRSRKNEGALGAVGAATGEAKSAKSGTSSTKKTKAKARSARPTSRKIENPGFRRIVIILIVAFVAFDFILLGIMFFSSQGDPPGYYTDPAPVLSKYVVADGNINEIAYDQGLSRLKFSNFPNLTIVNTASLKLIDNNKYKPFGPGGSPLFYDDLIIDRVMRLNNDWVDYLNNGNMAALNSVVSNSPAETKLKEWGTGFNVAYHRLVFGEMRHVDKNYYIITQATYTLAGGGILDQRDDVMIFRLRGEGNIMKVVDMELIPTTTSSATGNTGGSSSTGTTPPPTDDASTPPTDDASTPPTDDASTPPTDDASNPPTDDASTPPTDDASTPPDTEGTEGSEES
jgi:hypothetical protein